MLGVRFRGFAERGRTAAAILDQFHALKKSNRQLEVGELKSTYDVDNA